MKKILIIDDSDQNASSVAMLRGIGLDLHCVLGIEQAIHSIRTASPDFILANLTSLVDEGSRLAEVIHARFPQIPVLGIAEGGQVVRVC